MERTTRLVIVMAVGAGVLGAALLRACDPQRRRHTVEPPTRTSRAPTAEPNRPAEPARAPVALPAARAAPEPATVPSEPAPSALLATVIELARELREEDFYADRWETLLRATAGPLRVDAAEELRALGADAGLAPDVHLATCELLRVSQAARGERVGALEAHALAVLRRSAARPQDDPVGSAAAARALAALGEALDGSNLLADLRHGTSERGAAAALALAHTSDPEVALELSVERTMPGLVALRRVIGNQAWAFDRDVRDGVARRLQETIAAAETEERARTQAVGALVAWNPEYAVEPLVDVLADPASPPALVRSVARVLASLEEERAAAQLEELFDSALLDPEDRFAIAESLAPHTAAMAPALRIGVQDALLDHAALAEDALQRRRAVMALAAFDDERSFEVLKGILREDPSEHVRSACIVSLRRHDPERVAELMSAVVSDDPSEPVRRLAQSVLDQTLQLAD
jgi:hypothetical protein